MGVSAYIVFPILAFQCGLEAKEDILIGYAAEAVRYPFEVYVTLDRGDDHLGDLIASVQEAYFERYNEVNPEDEYDVFCYSYPRASLRAKIRYCGTSISILRRGDAISAAAFDLGSEAKVGTARLDKPRQFVSDSIGYNQELTEEHEVLRLKLKHFTSLDAKLSEMDDMLMFLMSQKPRQ